MQGGVKQYMASGTTKRQEEARWDSPPKALKA